MPELLQLSRRERQILDVIYTHGQASATEVLAALPDAPTRTSVRTLLRILEAKGHVRHVQNGREYFYTPTQPRDQVGRSALQRVLRTFFGGSLEEAVAAHLADRDTRLHPDEIKRLSALIRQAKAKEVSR